MDNAVYTFESLLYQELGKGPSREELCKATQRILERVLKVGERPDPGAQSPDPIPAPGGLPLWEAPLAPLHAQGLQSSGQVP